jgi:glycosyl transferase family 25
VIRLQEILVISLASAAARRRLMQAQLAAPGMPPHRFIDAVDGAELSTGQLAEFYDQDAAERRISRPLTLPEIGCAASHLAAYRHIADSGLPMCVVLEDDALLGMNFPSVFERLVAMLDPEKPQAVLLSHVVRYSAWRGRKVDKLHRLYAPYEARGAHAYLITRAGARAMLAASPRVRTLADDWEYFAAAGILDLSAVIPYIVGTAPFSVASQIGTGRHARIPGPPLTRWMKKHLWQKFLFQLLVKPALRLHKAEQTW